MTEVPDVLPGAVPGPAGRTPRPRRRFTLRRRLVAILISGTVLLAVVAVSTGVALTRMLDRQEQMNDRYFVAITQAETAYTRLVDAETAVRGYALTGSTVALEPYRRAMESAETFAAIASPSATEGVAEEVRAAATQALEAAQRWDEGWAQPIIELVAAEGPGAVTAGDVTVGQVLFDHTRVAVEHYLDVLHDRRGIALDELNAATGVVLITTAMLVAAVAVIGAGLWTTLRRWITGPLGALAADARVVSDGDLNHPVSVNGPGEIADLADDVERMRQGLVVQLRALELSTAEVAEAHERLTEQAEELRRSNRDLEQFAYVASHDLQEPLRKVASFTQLLHKRYHGQLDERADQYIDFAVDGAKRMQQLIQDLLGFSRVGRGSGQVADVALGPVLADALNNLARLVEDTGAEVTADPLPVVRGERGLLVQLLQNLVGNAIKFRDPQRPPRVHLSATRVDDFWQLACQDNGIGIEPQYAERIFAIFQRLHPKDVYEGTGIGLALCKKIVEHHGGRIWLGDSEGPGARICWTLPAVPDDLDLAEEGTA